MHSNPVRASAVLVLVQWMGSTACGCGASSSIDTPPAEESGTQDASQPDDAQRKDERLCDPESGDTSIRFAWQDYEGFDYPFWDPDPPPYPVVLNDNGHRFFAVDGQCRFWVLRHLRSEVRAGTLSAGMVKGLRDRFRLATWSEYVGEYRYPMVDGYRNVKLRLGSDRVLINWGACDGCASDEPVRWLIDQAMSTTETLHDHGIPVGGPVRFRLVAVTAWSESKAAQFENAPLWPLATSAASLAAEDPSGQPRYGLLTEGVDADTLRDFAVRHRDGSIGVSWTSFVPLLDEDGARYMLFVRDTVPFEDENGFWE